MMGSRACTKLRRACLSDSFGGRHETEATGATAGGIAANQLIGEKRQPLPHGPIAALHS